MFLGRDVLGTYGHFLRYENLASFLLNAPALDGVQRWSPQSLARAQVETCVVPGTSHFVANHKSIRERPVVVRTMSTDRKELYPASHQ